MALDQLKDEKEMTFLDHLDDLRKHLFRAAIYVLVGTVVCFIFADFLVDDIVFAPARDSFPTIRALCDLSHKLYNSDKLCMNTVELSTQNLEVAGQFMYSFRIAFFGGIILAFPLIINQIWKFVKPALSPKEIRSSRWFTIYTTFLFLTGVLFGYYMLAPISLNFFGNYKLSDAIENKFSFQSVINLVTTLSLATGLIFQLPILMYFVARLGLINSDFLKKNRRYAIVIIIILAAVATPPDVLSQFLLALPLLLLYEIGIKVVKNVEKKGLKSIRPKF
jgi:sec-independent protein translocase protein TatC